MIYLALGAEGTFQLIPNASAALKSTWRWGLTTYGPGFSLAVNCFRLPFSTGSSFWLLLLLRSTLGMVRQLAHSCWLHPWYAMVTWSQSTLIRTSTCSSGPWNPCWFHFYWILSASETWLPISTLIASPSRQSFSSWIGRSRWTLFPGREGPSL